MFTVKLLVRAPGTSSSSSIYLLICFFIARPRPTLFHNFHRFADKRNIVSEIFISQANGVTVSPLCSAVVAMATFVTQKLFLANIIPREYY